jgi:hypothetical protein
MNGLELDTSASSAQHLADRALPWLRSQLARSDRAADAETTRPAAARVRA